jgi:hypothetical protein
MRWKRNLAGLALGMCLLWQPDEAVYTQAMPEEQDAVAALLLYVNAARIANGLPPYALNPLLTQAAQAHSEYQRDIGHWSHDGAGGSHPIDRVLATGYPATRVNENLYATSMDGPEAVVEWWLTADEAHRNNVLHPALREVGFGAAADAGSVVYYTMNISAQPNVLPVFIDNDSPSASSPYVTLTLTNEMIFSGGPGQIGWASQVLISSAPDFAGAMPQSWAQTIPWVLDTAAAPGIRTVYVRFIDEAGRTADSQDSIFLEALSTQEPDAIPLRTATPTLLSPPSTYTPALPPTFLTPSLAPSSLTPLPPISTTPARPTTPTQTPAQAAAPPLQMLFVVVLGLGISALLVGTCLLVRRIR